MTQLDIEGIMQLLPHRYPFLLLDKVISLVPGERAVALKNVTINEPFFKGHFPHKPIMPGVLIIEAMAQLGGVMLLSHTDYEGATPLLTGVDKTRFRKQVVPGDQLELQAEIIKLRGNMGRIKTSAQVEGAQVSSAEMLFYLERHD